MYLCIGARALRVMNVIKIKGLMEKYLHYMSLCSNLNMLFTILRETFGFDFVTCFFKSLI